MEGRDMMKVLPPVIMSTPKMKEKIEFDHLSKDTKESQIEVLEVANPITTMQGQWMEQQQNGKDRGTDWELEDGAKIIT